MYDTMAVTDEGSLRSSHMTQENVHKSNNVHNAHNNVTSSQLYSYCSILYILLHIIININTKNNNIMI